MSRSSAFAWPAWFKDFLARYKRAVALALALGLLASACAALLMFTSGYLISATALAGTTLFSIMVPVGFVQLFGFGRPIARYLERLASHDWVLHVTSDLRLALYRAVEQRTGDPERSRAMGEYLSLLSDDVAHLQNLYLRVVFPSCIAYLLALGASVLFGFFSLPFMLIILLSFALVTVLLPLGCLLSTRLYAQRVKALKADEYAQLTDDVFGAVDWVLSGRGSVAAERHAADDAEIRVLEAKARMVQRSFSLASTLLLAAVLCAVIVWAGGLFGVPGANVNWIAAFALGFFPLIESFAVLPVAFSESTAHYDSLQRLDEYLSDSAPSEQVAQAEQESLFTPASLWDVIAEDAPSHGQGDSEGVDASAGTPAPKRADEVEGERCAGECDAGMVELSGVSYTYPGEKRPALDDLSLAIEPGESVAVLGRSGAGKSTFANVVCGVLVPDSGTLKLLGHEVSEGADLSQSVGFVGQVPYLFNRSLRDNLTLGVLEADDERLVEVLSAVGLGEKFSTLEAGLDTIVGETGVGFSGGEEHRVSLARMLVAQTPVVVVDEPFSSLDPETERDLLDTLLRACAGRTLLVITHHLAQVERFDRVVFIEDGKVDLDGTPTGLLETSSRFRALVNFDR